MINPIPSILHVADNSLISDTNDWPNCDVTLLGFEWIQQDCSVQLKLGVPNLANYLVLSCKWICWIKIEIDTVEINMNNAAPPLTWDTTYSKTPEDRWVIDFNFASDGQLKLECASMSLSVSSENCT